MNIIIPTYPPHFLWNIVFIKSFKKYCLDYENSSIEFIVNRQDKDQFYFLVGKYIDKNIRIKIFEDILENLEQDYVFYPTTDYEKYSFQAIKKMFAVLDSDYKVNLVLDSENVAINEFKFKDLFKNYNKIFYCDWSCSHVQDKVTTDCNKLLHLNDNRWFFESSFWIYNKDEFTNIFEYICKRNGFSKKEFVRYCKNIVFFEKNLYDIWNSNINSDKYILCNQKDCLESFKETELFFKLYNRLVTTEHIISSITNEKEIENYIEFVNKRGYNIFRVNQIIDDEIINKIIKNTDAKILTVFDNNPEIYNFWSNKVDE